MRSASRLTQTKSWLTRVAAVSAFGLGLIVCHSGAEAACLDLSGSVALEGALTFHIFGGPPYNGGVRLGDTPEPSYILQLDQPVCVSGDDFIDAGAKIDRVQVFPTLPALTRARCRTSCGGWWDSACGSKASRLSAPKPGITTPLCCSRS